MNQNSAKKTNKIEIRIQGKSYLLRGQEDVGYLQQIASFVNDKMEDINKLYSHLSTSDAAVLTSINISDMYFKEMGKTKETKTIERSSNDEVPDELDRLKKENERLRKEIENLMLKNEELGKNYIKLEGEFNGFIEEFDGK